MATDERLQSAFFATLVDSYASPVTLDPVIACSDAMKVMQLMSDSLLLKERDMPMNKQSFGANHETVIAQSRLLASCIKRLETTLSNGSVANLGPTLAEATDSLVQIIEAVAGLVFQLGQHGKGATKATPSVMDNYVLVRARLAVQLAVNHLSIKGVVPPMILAASAVIATHVEAVTEAVRIVFSSPDSVPAVITFMDLLASCHYILQRFNFWLSYLAEPQTTKQWAHHDCFVILHSC
eukprot:m.247644 g.247644  ORF g.247644 m.247644 type:complete len:238 (-) comp15398_c0_seq2:69-782(-)